MVFGSLFANHQAGQNQGADRGLMAQAPGDPETDQPPRPPLDKAASQVVGALLISGRRGDHRQNCFFAFGGFAEDLRLELQTGNDAERTHIP